MQECFNKAGTYRIMTCDIKNHEKPRGQSVSGFFMVFDVTCHNFIYSCFVKAFLHGFIHFYELLLSLVLFHEILSLCLFL